MRKIFAVTAIFFSSQLHAQLAPQPGDTSGTMDEVTLTANKYSTKTTETGKVVTVVSRQEIEHAGSRDLSQLITEMGGVFVNGYNSNPGKEKNIYLRGAKVEYTLITIDGIPVYDASGIGTYFDIRNIPIDNVERIEILKGSQGTLYGSDAIAGVINIITRKGGSKPFSISGAMHYGSFNTWRANASVSGKKGLFDYNIGGTYYKTDGFSEAQKPAGSTETFDKDGYKENNVQANFGLQVAKQVRIQPFLRYTKFKGSVDEDAFADASDFTNTNKNLQLGAKNTVGVGKSQISLLYQYTKTDRDYLDDSIQPASYFVYSHQVYVSKEHFAEAFIVYPFSDFKLTAGADLRSSGTDYSAVQKNVFSPVIDRPAYSADSVNQHQVGIYAALNYSRDNLAIEAGGRLNSHSEYGSNFAFNINPSYLVHKSIKLFFNVSSGYKTPSLYQLFSIYGNRNLKPEESLNLEGGLQYFTHDQKSSLRATYFNRHINDVIAFLSSPVYPYAQYDNQDKQNDHGIEVEGSSKFSDKFQLKAIYTYATGEITTQRNNKDTTFFNLLRRPKSTFNFSFGSQITQTLYMNAQLTAVGERKDVYFDPVTFMQQDITLKSYVLVNFYAEYGFAKNRLKVFADLRNIFNEKYSDIYGYNTAGFNAYGGIRFHF